jgi:hypothetical protein
VKFFLLKITQDSYLERLAKWADFGERDCLLLVLLIACIALLLLIIMTNNA